jgi:acyl carrier protein
LFGPADTPDLLSVDPSYEDRMEQVLAILQNIRPEFDFSASDDFISDGMLDSLDIVTLVSDLDRAYGISIDGMDIVPENFRNLAAIGELVARHRKP